LLYYVSKHIVKMSPYSIDPFGFYIVNPNEKYLVKKEDEQD